MAQAARVSQHTGFFHLGKLIEFDSTEVTDEASDELPGFGILAAGASLLFVSRRFRN